MATKLPEGVFATGGKGRKPCPHAPADAPHFVTARAQNCPLCEKAIEPKDKKTPAKGWRIGDLSLAQLQEEITKRTGALDKFGESYKTWSEAREVIQAVLDLCDAMGGEAEVFAALTLKEEEEE